MSPRSHGEHGDPRRKKEIPRGSSVYSVAPWLTKLGWKTIMNHSGENNVNA
jgi:hypothetical protein